MRWFTTLLVTLLLAGSIHAKDEIIISVSFEKHEVKVPVRSGITLGALIRIANPRFEWHEKIEDYTEAEWTASIHLRGDRVSLKRDGNELIKPSEGTNQVRRLTHERLSIEIKEGDVFLSSLLSIL